MFTRWLIRYQMYFGVAMLLVIVAILSFSSFQGVFKFRRLTKSIRVRAYELPLAAKLNQDVSNLRVTLSRYRHTDGVPSVFDPTISDTLDVAGQFGDDLDSVHHSLEAYRNQLLSARPSDHRIADITSERQALDDIDVRLLLIDQMEERLDWILDDSHETDRLDREIEELQLLTGQLPGLMKQRMDTFAETARTEYRAWIFACALFTILAILLIVLLVQRFNHWIFHPLKSMLDGSRRVAAGDFGHRIKINSKHEIAELASAMNAMTDRFCEIRDELDDKVKQRTKDVVRGEQLASVGFLAAGVAHEINNTLASIAWSAESLESRLIELLHNSKLAEEESTKADAEVLTRYLRRIQDEAFRCKGITDSLLNFSRLGDADFRPIDLSELINSVIEMVRHFGKYRQKEIIFSCTTPVVASVNEQETKQVVLNLITNALDSLDAGGEIKIELKRDGGAALLVFEDNGCGMTEEVREHLFEPFFTRRRDGQGTGLGLSITYQIINDHGGTIEVFSDGPGQGSTFRVKLPLVNNEESKQRQTAAA